jgi:hypothetical protein
VGHVDIRLVDRTTKRSVAEVVFSRIVALAVDLARGSLAFPFAEAIVTVKLELGFDPSAAVGYALYE